MGWGFIGAGRATRILIGGFKRANRISETVIVTDIDHAPLKTIKRWYPFVKITKDLSDCFDCSLIFLSVPFTAYRDVLEKLKGNLKDESLLVSLAPKYTLSSITEILGGFNRIVRMIPNAPSIINKGYNPLCFSPYLSDKDKEHIKGLFSALGECPEVKEDLLEAFVIVSAASPTYFWFQFLELERIGVSLGLAPSLAKEAVYKTLKGAVDLLYSGDFTQEEVLDLIPLKPLSKYEEHIKDFMKERLYQVFDKIKP